MEQETELVALRQGTVDGPGAPQHVQAIIDRFFADLKARCEQEVMGYSATAFKRNQQRLYMDEDQCAAAAAASQLHLCTHENWISGDSALSAEELRERIALQHFFAIDIEDLSLPRQDCRSDDTFNDEGICHQFILDAGRSDFIIDGERLSFTSELTTSGITLEEDPLEVESRLSAFSDRLVVALIRCLGNRSRRKLLQAISRTMSQSGWANVERACGGSQVVVSGGEQILQYELLAVENDVWEVRMSLRKDQFEECVLVDETSSDASGKVSVLHCSPTSMISRSCSLRFDVVGENPRVDLVDFAHELQLLDDNGAPLLLQVEAPAQQHRWKGFLFGFRRSYCNRFRGNRMMRREQPEMFASITA